MNFLKGFIASNGYGPTIKEIGDYFGWSSSASVHDKLRALENLGLIRRSRRWRGIEIVNG